MDSDYIANLNWIPSLSNENQTINKIFKEKNLEENLINLGHYNLDKNSIEKIVLKLKNTKFKKIKKLKILFITDLTLSFFYDRLKFSFLKYGIKKENSEVKFENFYKLNFLKIKEQFDFVFVKLDVNKFLTIKDLEINSNTNKLVKEKTNQLSSFLKGIKLRTKCNLIISNFNLSEISAYGNFDYLVNFSLNGVIKLINENLYKISIKEKYFKVFDLNSISNLVGSANFINNTLYSISKINYDLKYNGYLSERFSSLCASLIGKVKKVIVLDLDNTLWGGILGDDGYEGINLDSNDAVGEGFLKFQKTLLNYKNSGIILAVSSKNFEKNVIAAFDKNSKMIIKKKDISIFKCNWENKANTIQEISEILNLNLAPCIFLDDNPVERNLVRKFLPKVTVPELPEDPVNYAKFLHVASYFNKDTITNEDRKRTDDYISNLKRTESKINFKDYKDYLKSLNMVATYKIFEKKYIDRITQLIMRSNQFNLTTRRYNEKKIFEIMSNKKYCPIKIELKDKFSDNGIISLVILKFEKDICEIDSWIMSCRVLERGLEKATMKLLLDICNKKKIKKLLGKYIRTEKNDLVKDHYEKLKFRKIYKDKNNTDYQLILKDINDSTYNNEIKIYKKF